MSNTCVESKKFSLSQKILRSCWRTYL